MSPDMGFWPPSPRVRVKSVAADAEAAGEIGEQRAVFVVGMGDDDHEAGGGAEALESLLERCLAAVFRERKRDEMRLGCGSGDCARSAARAWRREGECEEGR